MLIRRALAPKPAGEEEDEVAEDEVVGYDSNKQRFGRNEAIAKLSSPAR